MSYGFSISVQLLTHSLNPRTDLDLLGHKYALNANAQLGNPLNGKTTANVELSVPGPVYLSGQLTRDATTKDGNLNCDTTISLGQSTDKATPGRKLTIKAVTKDTNIKEGNIDLTVNVAGDDSAGKTANMDISLKKQKNGAKRTLNLSVSIIHAIT